MPEWQPDNRYMQQVKNEVKAQENKEDRPPQPEVFSVFWQRSTKPFSMPVLASRMRP